MHLGKTIFNSPQQSWPITQSCFVTVNPPAISDSFITNNPSDSLKLDEKIKKRKDEIEDESNKFGSRSLNETTPKTSKTKQIIQPLSSSPQETKVESKSPSEVNQALLSPEEDGISCSLQAGKSETCLEGFKTLSGKKRVFCSSS